MNQRGNPQIARLASQGGHARAKALTKAQRSEAARRAVRLRWAYHRLAQKRSA